MYRPDDPELLDLLRVEPENPNFDLATSRLCEKLAPDAQAAVGGKYRQVIRERLTDAEIQSWANWLLLSEIIPGFRRRVAADEQLPPRSWIFRRSKSRLTDERRRRSRAANEVLECNLYPDDGAEGAFDPADPNSLTPFRAADILRDLFEAIRRYGGRDRPLLERVIQAMLNGDQEREACEEVAREAGLPPGKVEYRWRRGKLRLRAGITAGGGGDVSSWLGLVSTPVNRLAMLLEELGVREGLGDQDPHEHGDIEPLLRRLVSGEAVTSDQLLRLDQHLAHCMQCNELFWRLDQIAAHKLRWLRRRGLLWRTPAGTAPHEWSEREHVVHRLSEVLDFDLAVATRDLLEVLQAHGLSVAAADPLDEGVLLSLVLDQNHLVIHGSVCWSGYVVRVLPSCPECGPGRLCLSVGILIWRQVCSNGLHAWVRSDIGKICVTLGEIRGWAQSRRARGKLVKALDILGEEGRVLLDVLAHADVPVDAQGRAASSASRATSATLFEQIDSLTALANSSRLPLDQRHTLQAVAGELLLAWRQQRKHASG
jgi:DNA-directed RNA polymerase specialized sigma24 family protein